MTFPATRPLRRLLLILLTLGTFAILTLFLEPRHRSLTCRSIWSCMTLQPLRSQLQDGQIPTVPEEQQVAVTETTLADGTVKFHRKLKPEAPSILFLVLARDGHSWSRDFQSTKRSVYDFLDLLASTRLEPQSLSLGLLTESKDEFDLLKQATDEIPLGRVTVLWRNGTEDDVIGDGGVQAAAVGAANGSSESQAEDRRRAAMARSRNYLVSRSLLDEKHIIWVDAGVVEFSTGIVQRMLGHAQNRDDVGIITSRCEKADSENYDTDTWAVTHESELLNPGDGLEGKTSDAMIVELKKSRKFVPELIRDTVDGDIVPVHSVGGMILYVRAELVRQGLVFPWWKPVGTTWKDEGWLGLDTEGLCYLSGHMKGGSCYVLGGTHKVRHTDWG